LVQLEAEENSKEEWFWHYPPSRAQKCASVGGFLYCGVGLDKSYSFVYNPNRRDQLDFLSSYIMGYFVLLIFCIGILLVEKYLNKLIEKRKK
jgi:hypothetical protein